MPDKDHLLRDESESHCPMCGQALPVAPVSATGDDLSVLHLLHTLMDYGPASATELADFYNAECKYVEFDPLPFRTPQSIAATLSALRDRGQVESHHQTEPLRWQITDLGRTRACSFVGSES